MKKRRILTVVVAVVVLGFLVPESRLIPVKGATKNDWNKDTFWYEPWGRSGVHKGIDIFAEQGTPVLASTNGIVLYRGSFERGGNVVFTLGPKWRIHYYAHLASIDDSSRWLVKSGDVLGTLGDTGNAKGKPAHLHYSIVSLLPLPWLIDDSTQGYKKAFYLDPSDYFD